MGRQRIHASHCVYHENNLENAIQTILVINRIVKQRILETVYELGNTNTTVENNLSFKVRYYKIYLQNISTGYYIDNYSL